MSGEERAEAQGKAMTILPAEVAHTLVLKQIESRI